MSPLISMFIGLGGIFASGALLLAMLLVFNIGGATFGERALARWASRFSACVMLVLLGVEWYVFEVVCRPENPVWRALGALILVLILWSFFLTAFTNPGTPVSDDWQAWEALNVCADDRGDVVKLVNGIDGNDAQRALLESTIKLTVTSSGQRSEVGGASSVGANAGIACAAEASCPPSPGVCTRTQLEKHDVDGCSSSNHNVADALAKAAECEPRVDPKKTRRRWPRPGEATHCDKCQRTRPERAHHCRVCGVCVQHMDHHCPIVGNCIGQGNLKYFFVLNWWQVWGCLLFLLCPGGPCSKIFQSGRKFEDACIRIMVFASIVWSVVILCISFSATVKVLMSASKNETSIESLFIGANPYKLQSSMDNLREVLGPLDMRLFLPVRAPVSKLPLSRTADSFASSASGNYGTTARDVDRAV
eukprot:TRINITY_DN15820_c0_g1_i1.p1 TRINITY_DN15820_c0_g1~~TRINITY_DN15820_c0_g1_i1.p1  ORF type:complete len:420 (-),score=40.12 TRINITY_DN15820_c0_g1_i1:50-1309(-)